MIKYFPLRRISSTCHYNVRKEHQVISFNYKYQCVKPGFHVIVSDVRIVSVTDFFFQAIWTITPGFHTLVSDSRIVSVAECFVKRSGRSYENTLAIVSNDSYVRSEQNRVLSLSPDCMTKNSVTEMFFML